MPASEIGRWDPRFNSDDHADMHAPLLPNAKVLFHDWWAEQGRIRLWDPYTGGPTGTFTPVPDPPDSGDPPLSHVLFCSGHSFLADGRLLFTGGGLLPPSSARRASIYIWSSNSWASPPPPNMNDARWYPTCTTLSGLAPAEVLVISGYISSVEPPPLNVIPQVLNQTSLTWTARDQQPPADQMSYYPWMHVMPDGRLFHVGSRNFPCHYLNTAAPAGQQWDYNAPVRTLTMDRYAGSSVMYLPGKVIAIGGGPDGAVPPATAEFIDLLAPPPLVWKATGPMVHGRRHLNATLLADGRVLVTGGTGSVEEDSPTGAVREAELWDPATPQTWRAMASYLDPVDPPATYRGYHSTALLLADGRVLSGGGNDYVLGRTMEIFWPPYLFQPNSDVLAPRPIIDQAPATVTYGATFDVRIQAATPAHTIARATFLRLGSVTHSVNMDQRFLELETPTLVATNTWRTRAPANSMVAPAGYYVLFLINNLGVPSVAVSTSPALAILKLQS